LKLKFLCRANRFTIFMSVIFSSQPVLRMSLRTGSESLVDSACSTTTASAAAALSVMRRRGKGAMLLTAHWPPAGLGAERRLIRFPRSAVNSRNQLTDALPDLPDQTTQTDSHPYSHRNSTTDSCTLPYIYGVSDKYHSLLCSAYIFRS